LKSAVSRRCLGADDAFMRIAIIMLRHALTSRPLRNALRVAGRGHNGIELGVDETFDRQQFLSCIDKMPRAGGVAIIDSVFGTRLAVWGYIRAQFGRCDGTTMLKQISDRQTSSPASDKLLLRDPSCAGRVSEG
jgi:hypothetical protein